MTVDQMAPIFGVPFMLTSVELRNFKSFRHQKIDLEPLTVFVGPNASGKTSVLEAIWIALQATQHGKSPIHEFSEVPSLTRPGWDIDGLCTRGINARFKIECKGSLRPMGVRVERAPNALRMVVEEPKPIDPDLAPSDKNYGIPKSEWLKLDASKLSAATYADQYPPRLTPEGEGVASVLAHLALSDRATFDALVEEMRTLIPHFSGIRFTKKVVQRVETELVRFGDDTVERQTKRDYQGDAVLFDFQNAKGISAHLVSEGTLILLGLLTALLGPLRPEVLLLDDLEQALHPLAQKSLLDLFRKIMERFPNLQILATAHSPYLLDYLKPEEVRLLTIGPDGYSICGKLTDHPQFEKWKDEMAPGELWSLFGEKWIAEGAPK